MKTITKFVLLFFIVMLLTACNGTSLTQAPVVDTPIATDTLLPSETLAASETPAPQVTPVPTNTFLSLVPRPIDPKSFGPFLSAELPKDELVLGAHVYADNTCFDVGVYRDRHYIVLSCILDFTYPAPTGFLDANESAYLQRWVERFQSYEEPSVHGLIKFVGNGNVMPDFAEKLSIETLISNLEYKANAYVSGGGLPGGVLAAQRVLSQRLGSVLPDQVIVQNVETVDFPDTCLGAPKPDEVCAQVITQGLRVLLVAQGMLYEYHTDFAGYDIRQFGEPQIAPVQGAG